MSEFFEASVAIQQVAHWRSSRAATLAESVCWELARLNTALLQLQACIGAVVLQRESLYQAFVGSRVVTYRADAFLADVLSHRTANSI